MKHYRNNTAWQKERNRVLSNQEAVFERIERLKCNAVTRLEKCIIVALGIKDIEEGIISQGDKYLTNKDREDLQYVLVYEILSLRKDFFEAIKEVEECEKKIRELFKENYDLRQTGLNFNFDQ